MDSLLPGGKIHFPFPPSAPSKGPGQRLPYPLALWVSSRDCWQVPLALYQKGV